MTKTRTSKWSPEDKAKYKEEKQAEQKQLLEDAVAELTSQKAWTDWVRFGRTNLSKYSFTNALLIWSQRKDATLVRGKQQWAKENVTLNADAQPLNIFAPVFTPDKDENGNVKIGKDGKPLKRLAFFKTVQVYDRLDTDAPDPAEPEMKEIEGDDLVDYIAPLEGFARELGVLVRYQDNTGNALGWFDRANSEIVINKTLSANGLVRVLVHELAHAYGDVNYKDYSRQDAEVIVESATVMALGMIGFDTRDASVPYIASWGNGSLEALKKYAATTDDLVKTLTERMGL